MEDAEKLEKGMLLTDAEGKSVTVEKTEKSVVLEEVLVYNFHAEEFCSYFDAHELKESYVGKESVSKYDMKYNTKTGEIYLESKDGKIQIRTGLKHEP